MEACAKSPEHIASLNSATPPPSFHSELSMLWIFVTPPVLHHETCAGAIRAHLAWHWWVRLHRLQRCAKTVPIAIWGIQAHSKLTSCAWKQCFLVAYWMGFLVAPWWSLLAGYWHGIRWKQHSHLNTHHECLAFRAVTYCRRWRGTWSCIWSWRPRRCWRWWSQRGCKR